MPNQSELHPELLSTAAFNLMPGTVSGSRLQMLGSHLTQMLVLKGATVRRCKTGVEREYGKFTFKVKMPVDAIIIAVIPKYPETIGQNAIASNPMSIVVYENVDNQEICILEIPQYHVAHQYFGFKYAHKRTLSMLSRGASVPKGTVFADSPSIDDNGDYKFGVEANVAYLSVPGVIEDGFVISESFAKKLTTSGYETLDASWGKKYYPLNLYGDDTRYKPFPDIGERVRPDGLLMALREYDELLDPVHMTPAALRKVDTFDKHIYTKACAKVVDIVTRFDPKGATPETPIGMDEQARKYHTAQLAFYNALIDIEERLTRQALQRRETLKISRPFHRLLMEARNFKVEQSKVKATRIVQRQPLDEWRVDVTVEYEMEATKAFKLTGLSGDKGVICQVWPDADMPTDKHGTVADVITDGGATSNRMNFSRFYEHYLNATNDQLEREIKAAAKNGLTPEVIDWCWKRLLGYYEIVSPIMHDTLTSSRYLQTPQQHVEHIIKSPPHQGVHLFLPTDNRVNPVHMVQRLREQYPLDIGPIRYRGRSGNMVTTVEDVIIASNYIIMLEKTGSGWSAVSSGALQQHGILSKLTRNDKHARPGRASPTRNVGEDEARLLAAVATNNTTAQTLVSKYGPAAADGLAVAEMMDMANNPLVHQEAVRRLLTVPQPTNIQTLIDRSKFPRGGSRSLRFVKHHLEVSGLRLVYSDDVDDPPTIYQLNGIINDEAPEIDLEDVEEEES